MEIVVLIGEKGCESHLKFTYRIKLFIALFFFAIIITFSVAIFDFNRLKNQIILDKEIEIEQVTKTIKYALHSVDKAYFYLDKEVNIKMKKSTEQLQILYEQNKQIETWDMEGLSKELGVDIFILDEDNVIVYSNLQDDIGLDFAECCVNLNEILHERREARELFIDGIDVEQQTGFAKKYSYMSTPDGKYLIELGYLLEEEPIFQAFNFLKVREELKQDFSLIHDVQVLNFGGLPIGTKDSKTQASLQRLKAIEDLEKGKGLVEIESEVEGQKVMYRYVPYESEYDEGTTKYKVIEVMYRNNELELMLKEYRYSFYYQLFIILFVSLILTSIIAKIFAHPVYLAYHDSLTNLKNRASFDDYLKKILDTGQQTYLLMMDLDNFKLVNDYFGHDKGDKLLQLISSTLKEIGGEEATFRVGGDEFVIVIKKQDEEEVECFAKEIIETINNAIATKQEVHTLNVSISIGIAKSVHDDTVNSLYKRADIALYQSKEKGKNCYKFYEETAALQIPFDAGKYS